MDAFYDFEKPIANLEKKLQDLHELAKQEGVDFGKEITVLEKKLAKMLEETYEKLTPWQKVQLSRHPSRPHSRDYIDLLFPDFMELHGDRAFSDDQALLGGIASWPPAMPGAPSGEMPQSTSSVLILGHQKGRNTKQKMERNFGMARPEGYRKGMRLMELAERSKMPVITLIDTPGAYPGIDAEERGQSAAIAESIELMFKLNVPVASIVIGEGGSGGALAIGIANLVLMQEYSYYSVIAPESCAAILWSDSSLAERASEKLKMSPSDLLRLGVIDAIVKEPKGGAHRDLNQAALLMREALMKHFSPLVAAHTGAMTETGGKGKAKAPKSFSADRIAKFRVMGEHALAHAPISNSGSGA
ncbi:MAG: acetyl-CoA carboxylase carboxyltransferase subunit alpha [Oligoflexia bacterium]|nr:acetyl-CoA carboxylase carboxyltransferase subunit alpha [Oligoflexia bacterium]